MWRRELFKTFLLLVLNVLFLLNALYGMQNAVLRVMVFSLSLAGIVLNAILIALILQKVKEFRKLEEEVKKWLPTRLKRS